VAGVVEVARALRGASLARDVRLVLFPNEETPYFGTPAMGSLSYAWDLKRRGVDVSAMISVEMIGYFSEEAGSQSYPALPDGMLGEVLGFEPPTVGDFVAVVGRPEERGLVGEVSSLMRPATAEAGGVGVLEAVLPGWVRGVGSSDHWAFWRAGFGAVMVTDTSYYRNPHYHEASDTPETLDYGRMASVVRGIEAAVRGLAGGGG
jgi:Zn-dependent M28 family amino/carboxypeptidase